MMMNREGTYQMKKRKITMINRKGKYQKKKRKCQRRLLMGVGDHNNKGGRCGVIN